jgi:DNA polymerase-3 subunit delta'
MTFNWPIIGHNTVVQFLQTSLANNHLSQGYLFVGPEGVGKTKVMELFVASILCAKEGELSPCGKCAPCRELGKKIHPDVVRIAKKEGEKNISIEAVRELISRLASTSFLKSYKIAVVEGADELSLEAANALLKFLEEPSGECVAILLSRSLFSLPPTIISRLQVLPFRLQPSSLIAEALIKSGEPLLKARLAAALSFGRPGLALRLKEPEYFKEYIEIIETCFKFLSLPLALRFRFIAEYFSSRDAFFWLDILTGLVRDMFLLKTGVPEKIACFSFEDRLKAQERNFSLAVLTKLFPKIQETKRLIERNVNARFALEHLALLF